MQERTVFPAVQRDRFAPTPGLLNAKPDPEAVLESLRTYRQDPISA